jgi:diguanylate cyclase (GGDEF)-like protein
MADVRASRAVLLTGLLVAASYLALPSRWPQAAAFLAMVALPLVVLFRRLRRESLLTTRPWSYLIAGVGVYVAAAVSWQLGPLLTDRPLPFPSPLDAAFFAAHLLWASFLLGLLHRRQPPADGGRGERLLPLIDAGIFSCAALAVLWPIVIRPSLGSPGVTGLSVATAATYPLLTGLLFGLSVQFVGVRRRLHGEEMLLALWVGAQLTADTFYGILSATGDFHFGHPTMLAWLVSYAALTAAALHPGLTARRAGHSLTRNRAWSWLLLAIVLTPVPVAYRIIGETGLDRPTRYVFTGLLVAGVLLAFARLHLVSGDLSEQRRLSAELAGMSQRLQHQVLHDPLTGLGNRRMLMDRLSHAIRQRPDTPESRTGLLLLDLDGFKAINDTLGHACGDEALREVSHRLSATVRPGDTLCRLGGDEFAVVLERVTQRQAAQAAARIVEALRAPMTVHGEEVAVRASVGIDLADQATDPDEALKRADLAMYAAKDAGGDRDTFFDPAMQHAVETRVKLEKDLHAAADRGELRLAYQPIFDLATGLPVGVEALLRWHHPDRGLQTPGAFIEAAEDCGAIVSLGRWAAREACRQASGWAQEGDLPDQFQLAINVSRRQLLDEDCVEIIASAIEDSGIPASQVTIEVTETALMSNVVVLTARLTELRTLGATIAMDDFGAGYSSLEQLRQLPIDVLKIDRSFVARIDSQREDYALTTATVLRQPRART